VLCAAVLGLDDLARVGALLLLLPVISALVTTHGRHRLGLARTVTPARIATGQTAEVHLDVRNDGRSPTGLLLLEEHVPYALGVRPRFVIDRMGSSWHRSVSYVVGSSVRGRFTVGPMRVRVADPFGLVELTRTFQSTSTLVVTPPVVPLPAIPLTGAWSGAGENRPRDFAGGSAEDVTTREYRHGDDLRRVHWRASAHAGELMVRREEQPWQSWATLWLDNRRHVHAGAGATSSLEYAVSVAASVASHLTQRGYHVRLVTADGPLTAVDRAPMSGSGGGDPGHLLEALAVVSFSDRPRPETGWITDSSAMGLLVAVFGDIAHSERTMLTRLRHGSSTALAVALEVERWGRSERLTGRAAEGARFLAAHGWRAATAGPDDPLALVWQELGAGGRPQAATTQTAVQASMETVGRRS
jgi:uncharacterized protein (DUF58 family)